MTCFILWHKGNKIFQIMYKWSEKKGQYQHESNNFVSFSHFLITCPTI